MKGLGHPVAGALQTAIAAVHNGRRDFARDRERCVVDLVEAARWHGMALGLRAGTTEERFEASADRVRRAIYALALDLQAVVRPARRPGARR